ncbi:type II CAAX endopeptidase family protein [Desulfitobacterium metallireducens]|uniref:Abortive phage infection protein n=1 Tax=Desulfitobacterium metallireducens DSM 15288 TaxID=871968 RepID=W0EA87_9FIRM|nr:type II CAAX endopeptidase family protein [Desulfitobacterium metallireducens]AHF06443.1 abortive phage infection protein [Desulfitobacterium metallireducens DSM 15288]
MEKLKNEAKVPLKNPRWNIWQGLFLLLLILLIELPLGWLNSPQKLDQMQGFLHFLAVGIGEAVLYLFLLRLFMNLMHGSFRDLGFVRPKSKYVLLGFLMGIFLFLTIGLMGNFLSNLLGTPAPQSFTLTVIGSNYSWQMLLLMFLGGVLAPIKEEAFFRGLIYPPLRQMLGRGKGILLSAGFFAVLHSDLIRFLPLFVGGIILTWLYEKTSSIWPSIIAHGTWNILMALALWIQKLE